MKLDLIRQSIADNIYRLRKAKGLTQNEISDMAGFARTTITNIEGTRHSVTIEMLYAVANALECSVYDLLPPSDFGKIPLEEEVISLKEKLATVNRLANYIVQESN